MWKSAGRAPSLRVLPWHLPYNWGKSTEKPQSKYSIHITRNTHTLQNTHKHTHYKTYSYTHTHTHTHTNTRTHTLQNNIKPPQYKLKQNAYRKSNIMLWQLMFSQRHHRHMHQIVWITNVLLRNLVFFCFRLFRFIIVYGRSRSPLLRVKQSVHDTQFGSSTDCVSRNRRRRFQCSANTHRIINMCGGRENGTFLPSWLHIRKLVHVTVPVKSNTLRIAYTDVIS